MQSKFSIKVAVRVRPLLDHDRKQEVCVSASGGENVVTCFDPEKLFPDGRLDYLRENRTRERQYDFDYVFGPKVGQAELYSVLGAPLIDVVVGGYNATVFAYGQTGSGKTHTMLGEVDEPGLMGRTLMDLFNCGVKAKFTVSFIELYNEEIRDLLNPGASSGSGPGLDLREDPTRGPVVAGVTEVPTRSADQVMGLVHAGNGRRRTEGTAANPVSSRSHAVLQICMEQQGTANSKKAIGKGAAAGRRGRGGGVRGGGGGGGNPVKCSKLSLIDLAGSERAAKTENRGQRLVEGAMINRSLLALANCINALSKKGSYVNFRDSKLTRLLKDSLGGNTRTAMVAHASPSSSSFEETLNTLKWAHRARGITCEVRVAWRAADRRYGHELDQVCEETVRLREALERTAPLPLLPPEASREDASSKPSRKQPKPRPPPKGEKGGKAANNGKKPAAPETATVSLDGTLPAEAPASSSSDSGKGGSAAPPAAVRQHRKLSVPAQQPNPPAAAAAASSTTSSSSLLAATMASDPEDFKDGDEDDNEDDDDDANDDDASLLQGLDELRATRREVVNKLREQTALKQTLMELDDQNLQNKIEINKLKVKDIKPAAPGSAGKENASSEKAGSGSSKSVSGEASSKANENSSNDSKSAQRAAKKAARAKRTMQDLKQAIGHNLVKKEELEKELAAAERSVSGNDAARKLVSLAAQLEAKTRDAAAARGATSEVQASLCRAEHEVSLLEVRCLEQEQAAAMQEASLRDKDLSLKKVQLQVDLRDRALAVLCSKLQGHPSGVDVTSLLQSLASGPLEPVFNALLKEHSAAQPVAGAAGGLSASSSGGLREQDKGEAKHPAGGGPDGNEDEDEDDNEEDDNDDDAIEGTFQNLSRSLRRPKEPSTKSKSQEESKRGYPAAPAKKLSAGSEGSDKGSRRIEAKGAKDNDDDDAKTIEEPEDDDDQDSEDYNSDNDDDDDAGSNDGDDYSNDMSEFEAEPPLESPGANKGGRPPILA